MMLTRDTLPGWLVGWFSGWLVGFTVPLSPYGDLKIYDDTEPVQ